MGKIHIGSKIKEVRKRSGMTVLEFSKKIGLTRDGANKLFIKDDINSNQLKKISEVLNHDFFSYYSNSFNYAKDKNTSYGSATKDEVRTLAETVHLLAKEVKELREAVLPLVKKQVKPKKK